MVFVNHPAFVVDDYHVYWDARPNALSDRTVVFKKVEAPLRCARGDQCYVNAGDPQSAGGVASEAPLGASLERSGRDMGFIEAKEQA